jgi:hypothetical protein
MEKELKALLLMFSTDLHELEERFPEEDLPEVIDRIWMRITDYLEGFR